MFARHRGSRDDLFRGLRISELCGLRRRTLIERANRSRFAAKVKKERLVPIGKPALMAIRIIGTH